MTCSGLVDTHWVSGYETKPKRGWRKRPTVPRTHTVTNTQRKILSITMATYFQSSSTCERGRGHMEEQVWEDAGKSQWWQTKVKQVKREVRRETTTREVHSLRRRWEVVGSHGVRGRIRQQRWKERKELNIVCKPTSNWYIIYTGGNDYDNHIQTTVSKEATGVLTKLIEPQVLHIKGCFSLLGDFAHRIYIWRRDRGSLLSPDSDLKWFASNLHSGLGTTVMQSEVLR